MCRLENEYLSKDILKKKKYDSLWFARLVGGYRRTELTDLAGKKLVTQHCFRNSNLQLNVGG